MITIPRDGAEAPIPFKPETSLGYMVHYVGRLYARALAAELARHGVPIAAFPVLLALWDEDGRTQAELAVRAQIEQPTMAATLARMERDGLVTRAPDPRDRRAQRVSLTPRASELEIPLTEAARAINARSVAGLDVVSADVLLDALHEVAASLSRSPDEPAAPPVDRSHTPRRSHP